MSEGSYAPSSSGPTSFSSTPTRELNECQRILNAVSDEERIQLATIRVLERIVHG